MGTSNDGMYTYGATGVRLGNAQDGAGRPATPAADGLSVGDGMTLVASGLFGRRDGIVLPVQQLITGDSIWNVRKMGWGVRAFCSDIKLNQKTADVLGEMDYEIAAFTHGKHVAQNARETVRRFLQEAKRA